MGFVASSSLVRAEGAIDGAGRAVLALRDRLAARGKIPAEARIVETRGLPLSQVLAAYRELIAEYLPGRPELAQYIVTSRAFDAALLTVGDHIAGMVAGTRNDGFGVSELSAIVVAPEFRGGWGWANVALMAYAFELAAASGASRLRFEIDETNWNVLQGVGRVEGKILSVSARFIRELDESPETCPGHGPFKRNQYDGMHG
jgi:ribosomal protein S18 acetylase RimI-like enzyme